MRTWSEPRWYAYSKASWTTARRASDFGVALLRATVKFWNAGKQRTEMDQKMIVEFGVEVTPNQLKGIINFLRQRKIPFYEEPPRKDPYRTLDELEADCEGK